MLLTCSVYVAEISSDKNRCILMSMFIIFFTSGILISYVITYSFPWRKSCWVFTFLSIGVCFLFFFLRETPYWLKKTGQKTEAVRSLQKIYKITEVEAEKKYELIVVDSTRHSKRFIHDVVNSWKPFLIMVVFQICLQGSGYLLLITYSRKIFENIFLSIEKDDMSIKFSYAVFISSFFAPFASIYGSRKFLMTISSLGMIITLSSVLICINYNYTTLIPIEMYVYVFFSTVGIVTLSECLPSELYKMEIRGFMCGINQAFTTILQGTLIKIFPTFVTDSSIPVISTFIAFSIVSFFFGIYILPETKDKTLQEIQDTYFIKNPRILNGTVEKMIYNDGIKRKDQICEIVLSNGNKYEESLENIKRKDQICEIVLSNGNKYKESLV
ncbi:hypothetical protein PGB90_008464 [Kerria lacca]